MRLSRLQKHMLIKCFEARSFTVEKGVFFKYYSKKEREEKKNSIQIRIQNSIDNMVEKDWAVAYGHKTAQKFYIKKVRLTKKGIKMAEDILKKKQSKLPIK